VVFLDPYQDTPAFKTSNRNTQGDSSVKWQKTKADDDGTANHSYISITAMKEYAKTSFDELRVQEYILNSSKIFAVGCWVRATVTFTSNDNNANEVPEGSLGKIASFNKNGDAWIDFEGLNAQLRVFKRNFGNISVLSQEDVLKERAQREELAPGGSSSAASRAQLLYGCRIQVTSTCALNGKRGRILSAAPSASAPVKAQTSAQPQARILKSTLYRDFLLLKYQGIDF
jgi:hypothetical protein